MPPSGEYSFMHLEKTKARFQRCSGKSSVKQNTEVHMKNCYARAYGWVYLPFPSLNLHDFLLQGFSRSIDNPCWKFSSHFQHFSCIDLPISAAWSNMIYYSSPRYNLLKPLPYLEPHFPLMLRTANCLFLEETVWLLETQQCRSTKAALCTVLSITQNSCCCWRLDSVPIIPYLCG